MNDLLKLTVDRGRVVITQHAATPAQALERQILSGLNSPVRLAPIAITADAPIAGGYTLEPRKGGDVMLRDAAGEPCGIFSNPELAARTAGTLSK